MQSKYKVVSAQRYQFQNSQGQLVEGCKVQYIESSLSKNEPDFKGLSIITISGDRKLFAKLEEVPSDYVLEFAIKPDGRGRPVMTLVDINLPAA